MRARALASNDVVMPVASYYGSKRTLESRCYHNTIIIIPYNIIAHGVLEQPSKRLFSFKTNSASPTTYYRNVFPKQSQKSIVKFCRFSTRFTCELRKPKALGSRRTTKPYNVNHFLNADLSSSFRMLCVW